MNLKEQREKINLTQVELSIETQIPRNRIAKWESDSISPKVNDYKVLEKFFQNRENKIRKLYNICINEVEDILLTLKSEVPFVGVPASNNPKFIEVPFFVDSEKFEKWMQLCNELFSTIKMRKIPKINNSTTSVRFIYDILKEIPNDKKFNWLLYGEGNMQRGESKSITLTGKFVPLIPIEAAAGFPSEDFPGVRYEDCEQYYVPEFQMSGVEFVIRVSGSSMYPKYSNGDVLACKKINDILFFQWGKVYVIDSSQGSLVKRVFEDRENPDNLLLVSDNKENYPAFSIPKSDIRSLSIVFGVIRME